MFHAVEQGWTTTDYRLADVFDALAILIWQNTEDATKSHPRHRPKPIPRPTDKADAPSDGAVVPMGMVVAQVTTVGKFMAIREAAARRWRKRHGRE